MGTVSAAGVTPPMQQVGGAIGAMSPVGAMGATLPMQQAQAAMHAVCAMGKTVGATGAMGATPP